MAGKLVSVVAGGAGFLGSHFCEQLLSDGHSVICLDNFCTSNVSNVQHLIDVDTFRLDETDITRSVQISGAVDVVINMASPAAPQDYLRLPVETLRTGSIGTLNLLELARKKNARYLLASTSEVYGDPLEHPQSEHYWGNVNPIGPRAVYDEAKRFAEAAVFAYRRTYHVDTAIARIFNTHGPRMRQDDGRAVPSFVWKSLLDRPLAICGDGSQTRSIQYVDDAVEGMVRLLYSPHAGPVNIGNPTEITVKALAVLIRDLVGSKSPLTFVPRPEDDPIMRKPDISLAQQLLGWRPAVDLQTGLLRTIGWFREQMAQKQASVSIASTALPS